MIRRLLTLVSLAPAVGSVVLGLTASQALAQNVQCGDVITQDVTLDSDVLGCAGTALTVTGGDVTLDLNGHVVDGNIVAPEQEQLQGHLLIREGTVHGFIAFGQSKRDVSVEDVAASRVTSSGAASADIGGSRLGGGGFSEKRPATIHGNVVRDGSGISLYHSGGTITDNLIEGNYGVLVLHSGTTFLIGNTIRRNVHGVDSSYAKVIATNNWITENTDYGVVVSDAVIDFSQNVVSRNGLVGIRAVFSQGFVTDNTVDGNGDDGIKFYDAFFTVSRNHVWRNGNLGIEAIQSNTIGGGNWAKHNGNPLQCVPASLCSTKGKPKS